MKNVYNLSKLNFNKKKVKSALALLSLFILTSSNAFSAYYWQVSSIISFTGGNSYALNAGASPLALNLQQCSGGISQPHNSTIYNISWYRNTTNSTVGGTLVASNVVGTPYSFTTIQSYTPSTNTAGTSYYYAVLSNPSMTTCGFTGTLTSATQTVTVQGPSIPGAALNFDGGDDYVSIGSVIPASSSYTKEGWIKTNSIGGNNIMSSNSSAFWFWQGNIQAGHGGGFIDVYYNASSLTNTWSHVAVTYDAPTSTMKMYVNGNLVSQNNSVPTYGGGAIQIGAFNNGSVYNGSIDEVRIWNTARTQSEISANMNCEILSISTGLLAAYHFNQGVSENTNAGITSLTDVTGNFNGTLSNFALTGTTSNWIAPGAVISDVACAVACPTPTSSITSQSNVLCNGASNGAVSVNAIGGSSFTYSWAPTGGIAATASGLSAGNYICSIINNCGNTTSQSVNISQPLALASSQTITICDNQPLTVGTHTYSSTGVYTDVLTASNGCDSTVTTNLTVYPTFATSNTITLETGNSVIIGGIARSTSGVYVTNLTSVHGCDSIVTTTLNMILMWNPLNLVATASSQTQIDLTWADNSAREVGYMIERASSINGTFTQVGWSEENTVSISDLDLSINTNYCYRVVAVDIDGYYSGYTNTSCASTFGAVSIAASNLTATAVSQTGINLNWSDNSSDETGFMIVSEVNGLGFNTIATVAANVTSYSNVGLTQNTQYNYKVIAINQAGNSVSSNVGSALTFDGTPLAATNLVATALSALDIRLTWSDVAANETAYIVQRSLTSGAGFTTIATIPANSTSYSDYEGVNTNTTYFYQVLASNIGGSIASNEASALTSSTAGYVLTNQNMNCRDASICMPVISNHTINGAIGFDFTVNYDVTKYSFDGVSINNAMINPAHAEYSTFVNPDGTVKVIVNINGSAPINASFNGTGSLLCMNFTKNLTNEQGVHQINIGAVLESFSNDAILHSSNNGIVTVTKDTLAAGTLRSWNNNSPLSYNVNTPSQYLITKVYGSNNTGTTQSTNYVTPNMNGKYNHNIYDGQYVKIIRDIAPTTVMMPYINGTDITMVKQIALGNPSFLPNAYQMIAADVNMDGQVTAGDVTLIKQRSTSLIGQFPQMWNATNGQASRDWLFVDSIMVASQASFQRSTTYPAYNGTGFNKNHVPLVGLSLPVAVVYSGNCPAFTASSYRGILLGDVNGNFNQTAAGGNKSLDINSMAFELDGAVQQTECIFDIPFYAGSQIGTDVNAIDFDIEFDSTNLEFIDITFATSTETSEQLFNQISTNRVLFTSSDLVAFAPSTLLGYIRFKTTNNQIVPSDLGTIKSYINGEEKSVSVDGSINCLAQSGVKEVTESKNISIYPNPSKGTFNVELTSMKGEVTLSVVDFSGKMVKTIITEGGQIAKMDISELSKGIYMLHVNTNNSITTYRIVKQ